MAAFLIEQAIYLGIKACCRFGTNCCHLKRRVTQKFFIQLYMSEEALPIREYDKSDEKTGLMVERSVCAEHYAGKLTIYILDRL